MIVKIMRAFIISSVFLFSVVTVFGQHDPKPTSSFTISGDVKAPVTISIADLAKWKSVTIGDVIITNHLKEKKSEVKGLKGVLLTDVLSSVEINAESPKVLSEYYFICKANDGYTVVYSWNELFNTSVGETAYIVTEKEGKPVSAMQDAILMISPKDYATGRRHVKALETITVKRAKL
jgi:hypothetical protein